MQSLARNCSVSYLLIPPVSTPLYALSHSVSNWGQSQFQVTPTYVMRKNSFTTILPIWHWFVEQGEIHSIDRVTATVLHRGIDTVTIPEFTKERYLSRVAKARALVPLREKFAHFLFSSYLLFYFTFHLLCYISVSHKVCSFQWCQKFDMLHWEIKIRSQNGDSEWLCKSQPYLRVQNL